MRILLLSEKYPSPVPTASGMHYIHARCRYYQANGDEVNVLCFSARERYQYEGIKVFPPKTLKKNQLRQYDIVVSHAPNVRNHLLWLWKHRRHYKSLVFFFHGHECVTVHKYYPEPYSYDRKAKLQRRLLRVYDPAKLLSLGMGLRLLSRGRKIHLVFVSRYLEGLFMDSVRFASGPSFPRSVIPNPMGDAFIQHSYAPVAAEADFITIRSLDRSSYCVALLTEIARRNPTYRFSLYGSGRFFDHCKKPKNLCVHHTHLRHGEIIDVLNRHRAGLMLTAWDSHGVMAAEMATFGIPLVTSDITVCREVFAGFENVQLVPNVPELDPSELLRRAQVAKRKNFKFAPDNTAGRETRLFQSLLD